MAVQLQPLELSKGKTCSGEEKRTIPISSLKRKYVQRKHLLTLHVGSTAEPVLRQHILGGPETRRDAGCSRHAG